MQSLDKALLFSKYQVVCLKFWKFLTSFNHPRIQYFLLKLRRSCSVKRCSFFLLFCLDPELFENTKKICFYTLIFYIFINNSRYKRNLKNPEPPFVEIVNRKRVENFSKIIKLCRNCSLSKFSIFQANNLVSRK